MPKEKLGQRLFFLTQRFCNYADYNERVGKHAYKLRDQNAKVVVEKQNSIHEGAAIDEVRVFDLGVHELRCIQIIGKRSRHFDAEEFPFSFNYLFLADPAPFDFADGTA